MDPALVAQALGQTPPESSFRLSRHEYAENSFILDHFTGRLLVSREDLEEAYLQLDAFLYPNRGYQPRIAEAPTETPDDGSGILVIPPGLMDQIRNADYDVKQVRSKQTTVSTDFQISPFTLREQLVTRVDHTVEITAEPKRG